MTTNGDDSLRSPPHTLPSHLDAIRELTDWIKNIDFKTDVGELTDGIQNLDIDETCKILINGDDQEVISEEKEYSSSEDLIEDTDDDAKFYDGEQTWTESSNADSDSKVMIMPPWCRMLADETAFEERLLKPDPRSNKVPKNIDIMVEIFSITFHWKEDKTELEHQKLGRYSCYYISGNIFIDDTLGSHQKALQIPPESPVPVANGGALPIPGLSRGLWGEPLCTLFINLSGYKKRFFFHGIRIDTENKLLIKKDISLNTEKITKFANPMDETIYGEDGEQWLKVHYSVVNASYYAEVEMKLVYREGEHKKYEGGDKIRVDGKMSVRWRETRGRIGKGQKFNDYTFTLLEAGWPDGTPEIARAGSIYVEVDEAFPLWRKKIIVPCDFTLVFDPCFKIGTGDQFLNNRSVAVNGEPKVSFEFKGEWHNLQVNLSSYMVIT